MEETDEAAADEATPNGASPGEAFAALGNENRVEILRAFADAQSEERLPLAFSDLYDRVDIDGTNQLAYHLDKLEGVATGGSTTSTARRWTASARSVAGRPR